MDENANIYSENLFDFVVDKRMFWYYDMNINKCSQQTFGMNVRLTQEVFL